MEDEIFTGIGEDQRKEIKISTALVYQTWLWCLTIFGIWYSATEYLGYLKGIEWATMKITSNADIAYMSDGPDC